MVLLKYLCFHLFQYVRWLVISLSHSPVRLLKERALSSFQRPFYYQPTETTGWSCWLYPCSPPLPVRREPTKPDAGRSHLWPSIPCPSWSLGMVCGSPFNLLPFSMITPHQRFQARSKMEQGCMEAEVCMWCASHSSCLRGHEDSWWHKLLEPCVTMSQVALKNFYFHGAWHRDTLEAQSGRKEDT